MSPKTTTADTAASGTVPAKTRRRDQAIPKSLVRDVKELLARVGKIKNPDGTPGTVASLFAHLTDQTEEILKKLTPVVDPAPDLAELRQKLKDVVGKCRKVLADEKYGPRITLIRDNTSIDARRVEAKKLLVRLGDLTKLLADAEVKADAAGVTADDLKAAAAGAEGAHTRDVAAFKTFLER